MLIEKYKCAYNYFKIDINMKIINMLKKLTWDFRKDMLNISFN